MMNREQEQKLSQLIEELGPADPPEGLTRQVMEHITLEAGRPRARLLNFDKDGGVAMIRKAMWGLAAAAAIVLAVYSVTGFPPVGRGTEGTIGGAQKYQAPQISEKDVKLGDTEVQEFLQSDAFEQLAKDQEARDLIMSTAMRSLLDDNEVRKKLSDQDVRNVLTNKAVHRLFEDAELRRELEDQLRTNMSAEAVKKIMASTDARAARVQVARQLSEPGVRNVLSDSAIRKALDDSALRNVMADARMARALSSQAFARAIAHNGFARAMRTNAIETELRKK